VELCACLSGTLWYNLKGYYTEAHKADTKLHKAKNLDKNGIELLKAIS